MNNVLRQMTDFIFLEDIPEKSDIIFIPGGSFGALAHTAAKLWHQGLAPYILPSGKYSILSDGFGGSSDNNIPQSNPDPETEFEYMKALLIDDGVSPEAILQENQATYTYENAIFSRKVTDDAGLTIKNAIICCQAFHARRCLFYYELLYPDTHFYICPTVTQGISKDNWFLDDAKIDRVLGEIERCGSQFHTIIKQMPKQI